MSSNLTELNELLAKRLLPEVDPAAGVLLVLDDSRLHGLIDALGPDPLAVILAAVAAEQPVDEARGFAVGVDDAARWRSGTRPRPVPPQLALLCLCVLAASRMDLTEEHTAAAYYTQLGAVFDVPLADRWPPIPHARELLDSFGDLADWLADDCDGRRGELLLDIDENRRYVSAAISQTLLRTRDIAVLSEFFARYGPWLERRADPLMLLDRWGGRHQLTDPAQRALDDPQRARRVAAAILGAYRGWDGTRRDIHGARIHPVRLRLGVRSGQAVLLARLIDEGAQLHVRTPEGAQITLRGGSEAIIDWSWLDHIHPDDGLALPVADGPGRVQIIESATTLFCFQADELIAVRAPDVDVVAFWCLSADPDIAARDWPLQLRHPQPLPEGWVLLANLEPDLLDPDLFADPAADISCSQAGLALVGGLALGPGLYLDGHPPRLRGAHADSGLTLDGAPLDGPELPGDLIDMDLGLGVHVVADDRGRTVSLQITDTGLADGVAGVRVELSHPTLLRYAPTLAEHRLAEPGGPFICGAQISGIQGKQARAPVLIRGAQMAFCLYRDGRVTAVPAPAPHALHAQLGIDASTWAVQDDNDLIWICLEHPRRRRVRRLRDMHVHESDELLDIVWTFQNAHVVDHLGNADSAQAAWQALIDEACE